MRRRGSSTCGATLDTRTDGRGGVIVECPRCARQARGICADCSAPVAGTVGKALRCARHQAEARKRQEREFRARNANDPAYIARKHRNWRDRVARMTPEEKARRLEKIREYRASLTPAELRRQRRAYLLKQPERYLATQRRHNRDPKRVEKKRAAALARYYELHPTRPAPHCAGCGGRLDWDSGPSRGTPPKWCDDCAPATEKWRRRRIGRSIRVRDEVAA